MGEDGSLADGDGARLARQSQVSDNAGTLTLPPTPRSGKALAIFLPLPIAIVTIALTFWSVDIVSPAIADITKALTLSGKGAGLVFSAFFFGRLVSNIPASFLSERFGSIATAIIGGLLVLAGSLLAGSATDQAALLPARVIQGSGVSLVVAACLLSVVRTRRPGTSPMMIYNLAADIGGSLGLITGGVLTSISGWRSIFVFTAILGGAIVTSSIIGRAAGRRTPVAQIAAGTEAEQPATALPVSRRVLTGVLLANGLVYANYSVFTTGLPLLTAERFNAGAERIGSLLLVVTASHFLSGIPSGRAIRRWGGAATLPVAFLISAVGMALVLPMPAMFWLVIPMVPYAAGQVLGNSSAGDLLLHIGEGSGRAVGMVRLSGDVGMVSGPFAVGALADAAGISASFVMLASVAVVASLATWRGLSRVPHLQQDNGPHASH